MPRNSAPAPRNNPAPRSNPTPRSNPSGRQDPGPSSRPAPRSNPPQYNPGGRTTPSYGSQPVPRVSTRTDSRPAPSPTPRYNPGGGSVGGGNDTGGRPVGGTVRSGGTISRPTVVPQPRTSQPAPRPSATRPGDATGTRGGAIDGRYRSPQPNVRQPAPGTSRIGSEAGTPVARPRNTAPVAAGRYRPNDTVRANPRPSAPVANARQPVAGNTTARLQPRAAAPRLVAPRANAPRSSVIAATRNFGGGFGNRFRHGFGSGFGNCRPIHGRIWNNWWDPCGVNNWGFNNGWGFNNWGWGGGFDPWCWNSGWSIGFGGGAFGWNVSLWQPWWAWRGAYWNTCYNNAWWWNWSQPGIASAGFWWYPETVYCPTYLTVPSTVIVVDDREGPDGVLVSAPAARETIVAGDPGITRETIVAGGGIVGTARIIDRPADATSDAMAVALAVKYVELGDFYFRADRFADAAEAYGKARSYAPNDASVHFVLADAAFGNGDYHYAAFLIAEALRLDPSLAAADTDKRTFYSDVKVFDAQVQALAAYLEKKPYDAQAHLVHGYNLRFSGQPAAAMAAFRRVLEIAPDNRAAPAFLAALAPAGAAPSDR
ncbi:MAG: hypothetical protein MUC36_21885 [Planctomycetes bacterium]|nr:hypothetical protein [Planctomycetota bacterium]